MAVFCRNLLVSQAELTSPPINKKPGRADLYFIGGGPLGLRYWGGVHSAPVYRGGGALGLESRASGPPHPSQFRIGSLSVFTNSKAESYNAIPKRFYQLEIYRLQGKVIRIGVKYDFFFMLYQGFLGVFCF